MGWACRADKERDCQTHPQSHWKLDDDSMSYTVDKISHSVPQISEAESLHSPGPPGLDDNEDWLFRYFDRIEDFEGLVDIH
jgi:hypothetical protein